MVQSGSKPTLYLVLPCTLSLRKALKSFDNLVQHICKYENHDASENFDDDQEDEGKIIKKNVFFRVQLVF